MSRLPGPLAAQAILTALAQCAGAAGARNAPRDTYNYVIGTQTIGASYLSPFPFGITPDVLNSLHLEGIGFGALEKEQDRKARLFREKVEEIEMESWRQAGCPEGGPVQFRAVACDQLKQALEGEGGRLMANMTDAQLSALLIELTSLPDETEWVEWKHDYTSKEIGPYIAEYLSALANSAALHSKETAYLVWGIEDGTRNVVGTKFKPRKAKQGNEELENWLMRSLHPQVNFQMHEWAHQGKPVVLFEIPRATQRRSRILSILQVSHGRIIT